MNITISLKNVQFQPPPVRVNGREGNDAPRKPLRKSKCLSHHWHFNHLRGYLDTYIYTLWKTGVRVFQSKNISPPTLVKITQVKELSYLKTNFIFSKRFFGEGNSHLTSFYYTLHTGVYYTCM